MMLLDGKKTSEEIGRKLKTKISTLDNKIKLAVILVGSDPASVTYVNMKRGKCLEFGIETEIIKMGSDISENDLLGVVDRLNKDANITGILIQLPLPPHIDKRKVLDKVDIKKDVDGLNSYSLTKILLNEERILPCTPKGVIRLLEEYGIGLKGKNVCVIGFSDVVGKPLAVMCLNRGATVSVCTSKTKNLKEHTLSADILMTATGVPNLVTVDMVKHDAVVVDIGISKVSGKVVGDVDFCNVKNVCSYITPVPGGVGPMTIISLVENLIALRELYG